VLSLVFYCVDVYTFLFVSVYSIINRYRVSILVLVLLC